MCDRMSDPSASPGKGGNKKRNLPSWMSAREDQKNGGENQKQAKGGKEDNEFSKLLVS